MPIAPPLLQHCEGQDAQVSDQPGRGAVKQIALVKSHGALVNDVSAFARRCARCRQSAALNGVAGEAH